MFPANAGSVIRIKGLKDSASSYLRIQGYSADGAKVGSGLYLTKLKSANNNGVAEYVSVTDDEYAYTLYRYTSSAGAEIAYPYAVSQIRVTGHLTGTESDVIVTLDQEIAYTTPSTGYAWANTGHAFVPAEYEDRIVELEGAVEVLKSGGAHSGARWFALGDSITQGWTSAVDSTADSGYKQYLNTNTAERWVNIVAAMNGYALTNHGVGGTGYLRKSDTTMNARELVDTIDFSQCDFVTLAYGVNDWKYAVNIGSLDDDIAAGGSMVANMRYVIQKILTDNPLCKIFVITPINCRSLGTYATNWGINYAGDAANNLGLEDIFELQKAVCEYHGIELIDMTHSSVVNRENIKSALADNVHPTVECHKAMARELARKISFV
jgi:lysophospholipase L1-like esterase